MVVVCMITKGLTLPVEDTAEPGKDSLLTAEHHNIKTSKAQDDSSAHSNTQQADGMMHQVAFLTFTKNPHEYFPKYLTPILFSGPSITEIALQRFASSAEYPDNAKPLPLAIKSADNCKGPGVFPDPERCISFHW